jgi:ankyrin repeat protein
MPDPHGNTPLGVAARDGDLALTQMLLGSPGISVNCSNTHGVSPLAHAATWGHTEVVWLLLG